MTPREAVAIQRTLREQVRVEPLDLARVTLVGGADISANRFERVVYAGVVVLELASLRTVAQAAVVTEATFPYVPGLLSFREIPPLLLAWEKLATRPDVLLCDGQGLAHPRRLGLATHTGLALDLPTVGCAKSRYVGDYDEPGPEPGDASPLRDGDEVIGSVLRTRRGSKPLFVSVGHRCTLSDAVDLVQRCSAGYRLPETTRRAHDLVNRMRRGEL